ncbi:hypothetical protein DPMN_110258 [Dreissena polymorpha]|uniref:Uncharacterized protein n=1 Tax=Dreissena polymorpha TaxID=45954 RepID=A0A9D4QNQ4_DREPO|nr:hypothetical protein DPMN_110258 [Dreissena polymorpha]
MSLNIPVAAGDIGNAGGHARNNVYRIREPSDLRHDTTIHVADGDKLEFKYETLRMSYLK